VGRFAAVGALALGVICISTSAVLVLLANVGAPASVVSATLLLQGPLTALVAFIVLGQAVSWATLAGVLTVNFPFGILVMRTGLSSAIPGGLADRRVLRISVP